MDSDGTTLRAMDPAETVYREAVDFIDGGNHSFRDLVEHCLASTSLRSVAVDEGFGVEDMLLEILETRGEICVSEGVDLVIRIDELLDGLTLTHRVSANELEEELLEATPDLVEMFANRDLTLAGGGPVGLRYDWTSDTGRYSPHGSLAGPPGWLERFSPGDLVAFAYRADGLHVDPVSEVEDGCDEQDALIEVFEESAVELPEVGFDVTSIVNKTLMRNLALFRTPVLPISELLEGAGLELTGAWVGRSGEDWEPLYVRATVARASMFAERRRLAPCCAFRFETVVSYAMGRDEDPGEVNAALNHGSVAGTFQDWWMDLRQLEEKAFAGLLETLLKDDGRNRAGARYLMAIHHDARGDAVSAELQLEQAIIDDPSYPPALWTLAGYASDRGDLRRAVSLWQRSGEDPDEGPIPFHQSLEVRFDGVGRNETCPCGSGRKFKQCHLDNPIVPDSKRVSWMMNKVFRYLNAHHRHDAVAALVVEALGDEVAEDQLQSLWADEFVYDLSIFEDGILEDFVADRADLLPADELAIYRTWSETPLRCWEVTSTNGTDAVGLRDTATGESVEVIDRTAAASLEAGQQILTRVLPAFGFHWLSPAGLHVDLRMRNGLLGLLDNYPPPEAWVEWYASLFAPPTLTTTDFEPLVFSTAVVRPTSSWDDLEHLLDETYEGTDEGWWHEFHRSTENAGGDIIRGSLRREGDVLEIHTMASERLDRILETLGGHVELVERSDVPHEQLINEPFEEPELVQMSPEQRAEIVAGMEARWLDESVPALGGLTPRQAAADPTRREDLIALLRQFDRMPPIPDHAMTFDPDSLRRKLGLED